MKDKIIGFVGLLAIGLFFLSMFKSIYTRYFSEPEFKIIKNSKNIISIKESIFWYETSLEKTSTSMISANLSREESLFVKPLFDNLKTVGMVNEYITTMSASATQKMIELDAYRGTELNV